MTIHQLSVFVENKSGTLLQVLELLKEAHIQLIASTISDTVEYGIYRIICSEPLRAYEVLKDAGISAEVIRKFAGEIPILGVCLGHQTIGYVTGATVKKGTRPMHGKLSPLTHSGEGLFRGLPQDFLVTRYHSLVIDEATLPQEYQVDARTEDQAVMAISHRTYPIYGVQFHPEAVLTQYGHELLEDFHCICQQWQQERTEVCYA